MDLKSIPPLFLPPGSIRSILALMITLGYIIGKANGVEVVGEEILLLVLGVYFTQRGTKR